MFESLESRKLMSASASQLQADVSALGTEIQVAEVDYSVFRGSVVNIPDGTKGKGPLLKAMTKIENDADAMNNALVTDVVACLNDQPNPTAEAQDVAKITLDGAAYRTELKVDFLAVQAPIKKHGAAFAAASTDYTIFLPSLTTDWTSIKADYKQLKSDFLL